MVDVQDLAFRWASYQSVATALALLAIGLLSLLQGFRFARFLLAVTTGGGGFLFAYLGASLIGTPPLAIAAGVGAVLGALALFQFRVGIVLSSGVVFAVLAHYLAGRFIADPLYLLIAGAVGGAFGLAMKWICYRHLPIILTTTQGAAVLIVAFVGLTSDLAPSLASTFVEWSGRIALMIPVLMTMLFVLGYSVQANMQQGDMMTGAGKGWNSAEAA